LAFRDMPQWNNAEAAQTVQISVRAKTGSKRQEGFSRDSTWIRRAAG